MRLEIKDFTGGITDFVLSDDISSCEILDNAFIAKDRALVTRSGSELMGTGFTKPMTSAVQAQSIHELLNGDLVFVYGKDILIYNNDTGWIEAVGFNLSSYALPMGLGSSNQSSCEWNKHLFITDSSGSKPIKLFKNSLGVYNYLTSGLPELSSNPVITSTSNDSRAYIYTFCYVFNYYVEDVLFSDYGPTSQVQITGATSFSGGSVLVSSLPVLSNDIYTSRDTSNVKLNIYRTANAGTTSYLVASLNNGITSYTDTTSDEALVESVSLYTTGGISSNAEPPLAKFMDICSSCGWYANIKGFPYRVMQSQIGDPDSVPLDYYLDFENEVTGISSYQSNPIVFTGNQVWRIEGVIELDGSGYQKKVLVGDRVGCINSDSIIKTDSGLFFAGVDSFYFTNGYEVKKIPSNEKNIPRRYKLLSGFPEYIKGAYDRLNQRVYWTTKSSANSYQIYVYDITFNALSTISGSDGSFNTTAIEVKKDGNLVRGDESGYVFIHDENLSSDPKIDLMENPSNWGILPIIYNWKHIAFDFGVSEITKYVTRVTVSGEGESDLDLALFSYDDSNILPKELFPINFKSGLTWNDENWIWEDNNAVWELEQRLLATRWFKSGKIRCKRKQLQLTNAITNIAASVDGSLDTYLVVNSSTKQATLVNPLSLYIPPYATGLDIVIGNINYKIASNSADTVQILDPANKLTDGTFTWAIVGYKPNQRLHLKSLVYTYETLDDKGSYYSKGENGV